MTETEPTPSPSNRLQEMSRGFSVGQQAAIATAAAVLTGLLLAVFGRTFDLGWQQVLVVVAALAMVGVVVACYALFRAMLSSAEEADGDAAAALTYPLFPALFVFLSVATSGFLGLYFYFT